MKIAFVLDDSLDKSDGVQQYVLTLGSWYRTQGHDVHYLVGQTERTDILNVHSLSRNVKAKLNQNRVSTPLPASKERIRKIMRAEQFDVLHVQLPYSPLLAARVIRAAPTQTAVVGTFHIIPYSRLEAAATVALGLVLRRTLHRFDKIYSVSEPAQHFARRSFRIQSEVLPNTVNVARIGSAKPFQQYSDQSITIVFLGRLVERKGCLRLLEALEVLHKDHKLERVRVLIGGKGPLKQQLEAFVRKKHLGHVVHFLGYVDEVAKAKYLASADIAVFPSTGGESFGIVLIEAMAAGSRLVLAGDNVGYSSVMAGKPEQLINPHDVQEFAKRLHHFMVSSRARNAAHTWQQEQIKRYDVKLVGGTLLQSYETVIAKKHQSTHNNH